MPPNKTPITKKLLRGYGFRDNATECYKTVGSDIFEIEHDESGFYFRTSTARFKLETMQDVLDIYKVLFKKELKEEE